LLNVQYINYFFALNRMRSKKAIYSAALVFLKKGTKSYGLFYRVITGIFPEACLAL